MTEATYKKLSLLIRKYCPDFVVDKYPKFIAFLQAYYDWSMNNEEFNPSRVISHFIEWGDIDETLDQFIDYFKAEYLDQLNVDFNGDVTDFIKHTKEFYSSRGTPESFRFLLKLLSGNSGEIFYPNQYLMKSSDGEWVTDKVIFVEASDLLTNDFISTKIQGKTSGSTAVIESIETHFNYNTQEQFIKLYLSDLHGTFDDEIIVFSKDGTSTIELHTYDTVKKINIIAGGNHYKVNDSVSINDDPTFIGRVSAISSGKVDSYVIFDPGTGYHVGDEVFTKLSAVDDYYAAPRVFVDEVDSNGGITSLDIRYPGYGLYEVPTLDYINRTNETTNLYAWRATLNGEWLDDIVYTTSIRPYMTDPLYDSDGVFIKKTISATELDSESSVSNRVYIIVPPTNYVYYRYSNADVYNVLTKPDWKLVPSEYTPLQYIDQDEEHNPWSIIDTGLTLDQYSGVEIKLQPKMPPSPEYGYGCYGAGTSANNKSFCCGYYVNENKFLVSYGNRSQDINVQNILSTYTIKQIKNNVYLDGSMVYSFPEASFSTTTTAGLFGLKYNGTTSYGNIRLYYCKFFRSGRILKYYIPCKRNSDDVIGVYDIISNEFLTDSRDYTFLPGPEYVEAPDPTEASIEFISDEAGAIKSIDVVSAEINYVDNTPLVITSSTGWGASATITTGKVFSTIPYYYKPGSFLSDDFKLQDSDYWQDYSYEIRSSLTLDNDVLTQFSEYKDIFKQLVHPAGFKLFNSFVLSNHIDLSRIYINSTVDLGYIATFVEFVNWIEMVSSWNRIVDNDIIFQHRFSTIANNSTTPINYYERTGGEYVHSTIEIE